MEPNSVAFMTKIYIQINDVYFKIQMLISFILCQLLSTIDSDAVSEKLCLQQHKQPNYCPLVEKWQLTCCIKKSVKNFVIR